MDITHVLPPMGSQLSGHELLLVLHDAKTLAGWDRKHEVKGR
jgi:hypothetical protein